MAIKTKQSTLMEALANRSDSRSITRKSPWAILRSCIDKLDTLEVRA